MAKKRTATRNWIGEYHWTHGPLVLGTERARAAMAKALAEPDRKKLVAAGKKLTTPIVPMRIGGHALYVLPDKAHTVISAVDRRAVVLLRRGHRTYANPGTGELDELMGFDPGWSAPRWKAISQRLVVPKGGLVLFDAVAQHPEIEERATHALALPLPAGTYVVEHVAKQKVGERWELSMLYLHPAGHRPDIVAARPRPAAAAPLQVTPAVARSAKKLSFVSTTGGPLLFLPARLAAKWWGVCNEKGEAIFDIEPCDYDRACATRGDVAALKIGKETVLVLGSQDPGALHAIPEGALLLRWVGADHGAALLAAALGPGSYESSRIVLTSRGEPWVLMDSSLDGRRLKSAGKKEWSRITLPAGRYRVEPMTEWRGTVQLDGKTSDVLAGAVRLSRRGR